MNSPAKIRRIADQRLLEAKILVDSPLSASYEGAYYLAGYCVELYLKAKICERLDLPDLFQDADSSVTNQASFSHTQVGKLFKLHELPKLLLLSGLSQRLDRETIANQDLVANWSVIKGWKETKRYSPPGLISKSAAESLIDAIQNTQNGFLQWILNQ